MRHATVPNLDAARRAAESELDALRSENGALRRAALESESKRTTEVGAYQAAMEASQQRTREQLAALREAQQAMHAELPALREKLAHTKAQISQLALLIFGGEVKIHHESATVTIDDEITFTAPGRVAVLLRELRGWMDKLLLEKITTPALQIGAHPVLSTIVHLFATERAGYS